ncbi:MAG: flagellar basal body-associated FliL family protein [Ignavibacteriaceae bacterium]|jgi:flagellar FliL protein
MPAQEETLEAIKTDGMGISTKKSSFNPKVLLFGIPIFIVQLVVVYFITATILMKKFENQNISALKTSVKADSSAQNAANQPVELGKNIYPIEDIVVNPADTDGKRLLLTSIGIDLSKPEMQNEIKTREVMVKDIVISTLASKNISQLDDSAYRDTLKIEIISKMKKSIPSVTVNNIYFSKYIIQ